jgi:quercetin dioxygenase-like cupin family protein
MEYKEPFASQEEHDGRVLHIGCGHEVDLGSHGSANVLLGQKLMMSFVDMPPNSFADVHRHPDNEQVTIILKGEADFVVEGKVYNVKEGDVLVFLPDVPHGAYMGPSGARVLDIFTPPRADLMQKIAQKQQ